MRNLIRSSLAAYLAIVAASGPVSAFEPIEGLWRTEAGTDALIDRCDGAYCITICTGPYAGSLIGRIDGSGTSYTGTIIDPEDNKPYQGYGTVSGDYVRLKGCAFVVFCQTQVWRKLRSPGPDGSLDCAKSPFIGS